MTYRIYDDVLNRPDINWVDPHKPFFEWNNPFEDVDPAEFPRRWCIVGGGVAGLTAAYEVARFAQSQGIGDVMIDLYERADKLGGRIKTHQFASSPFFAELGPMRIPSDHKVALHYIEQEFQLKLGRFSGDANYFYRGKMRPDMEAVFNAWVRSENADINGLMRDYVGRRRHKSRESVPLDPLSFMMKAMNELSSVDLHACIFAARHGSKFPTATDRILDFYRGRPLTDWGLGIDAITVREAFDIAMHLWLAESHATPQVKRNFAQHLWDEVATLQGLNWLEHISCLHFLREEGALGAQDKRQLVGGFGSITSAFESYLHKAEVQDSSIVTIKLETRVREIALKEDCVEVMFEVPPHRGLMWQLGLGERESRLESLQYDRVICAVPTSAVRQISFVPGLESDQKAALAGVSYLSASKSAVLFKQRWWELGLYGFGAKAGGCTFTDLSNQQIWYPNDNLKALATDDEFAAVEQGQPIPSRAFESLVDRGLTEPGTGPASLEKSKSGGALIAAYMWGQNADRFASLSPEDQEDEIVGCLEAIAPGCHKDIEDMVHKPWNLDWNPAGGAFAWYEPAQQTRYQMVVGRPLWPLGKGGPYRVTFAGEHLGLIQGWIQGAMQSSLAALRDSTR